MHIQRFSWWSFGLLLCGCVNAGNGSAASADAQSTNPTSAHAHAHASAIPMVESPSPLAPPTLDPKLGRELGIAFEAFLSPHQEGGEEEDTPSNTPAQFRSTGPSKSRAQREADGHRGHGVVRFSKDLSRAWIDVKIEGIDLSTIKMFHIHCGKPGILGPILVDFALATDIQKNFADGVFSVEIRNEHIANTAAQGEGFIGANTLGCPIKSVEFGSVTPRKVATVAGMAQIAMEGDLYFNLHTTGQMYFGDIRGQIFATEKTAGQTSTVQAPTTGQ